MQIFNFLHYFAQIALKKKRAFSAYFLLISTFEKQNYTGRQTDSSHVGQIQALNLKSEEKISVWKGDFLSAEDNDDNDDDNNYNHNKDNHDKDNNNKKNKTENYYQGSSFPYARFIFKF